MTLTKERIEEIRQAHNKRKAEAEAQRKANGCHECGELPPSDREIEYRIGLKFCNINCADAWEEHCGVNENGKT